MNLLDRYVLRSFLEPFFLCIGAFLGIWLIFDMSDHGADFIRSGATLSQVGVFYLLQMPQIMLLALPVGILLALLFCCSRMSRSNEIISMLTAGRSLSRVLLPLMIVGALVSLLCLAMNYELAPRAEARKRAALEDFKDKKRAEVRDIVEAHLFRDRMSDRTWYVRRLKLGSPVLEGVQVLQQDAQGNVIRKWYAARAIHDPVTKRWTLQRGMVVDLNTEGEVLKLDNFEEQGQRILDNWPESPWRIASSRLDAQQMTIPELEEYLENNTDFPSAQLAPFRTNFQDRWALPWNCFVVVFIAAPLGIVYSRRGMLQGIAAAIVLFFVMIMTRSLFLALGKGDRISAELAAWGPLGAFFCLGLVLLWIRSSNRDMASFFARR